MKKWIPDRTQIQCRRQCELMDGNVGMKNRQSLSQEAQTMNKLQFLILPTETKLHSILGDLLRIMVQDPKIGMKQELNHGIETKEHGARIKDWKEHGNNVIGEATNHAKVQFVETKEK